MQLMSQESNVKCQISNVKRSFFCNFFCDWYSLFGFHQIRTFCLPTLRLFALPLKQGKKKLRKDMGPRECIKKYWLYIRNLPEEHGVHWKIWSLYIKSLDIILSAREYQEIHPYSDDKKKIEKIHASDIRSRWRTKPSLKRNAYRAPFQYNWIPK